MKEGGACCSAYTEGRVLAQGQRDSFIFREKSLPQVIQDSLLTEGVPGEVQGRGQNVPFWENEKNSITPALGIKLFSPDKPRKQVLLFRSD